MVLVAGGRSPTTGQQAGPPGALLPQGCHTHPGPGFRGNIRWRGAFLSHPRRCQAPSPSISVWLTLFLLWHGAPSRLVGKRWEHGPHGLPVSSQPGTSEERKPPSRALSVEFREAPHLAEQRPHVPSHPVPVVRQKGPSRWPGLGPAPVHRAQGRSHSFQERWLPGRLKKTKELSTVLCVTRAMCLPGPW